LPSPDGGDPFTQPSAIALDGTSVHFVDSNSNAVRACDESDCAGTARIVAVALGSATLAQIAVDDASAVGRLHRLGQRLQQRRRLARRQRGVAELAVEAAAWAELHRQERLPVVLADLEDLDDVGVLQPGNRLGLGAEAGQGVRTGVTAIADHFQRHNAVEPDLPGLVNEAHAALAERLQDLVARHHRLR